VLRQLLERYVREPAQRHGEDHDVGVVDDLCDGAGDRARGTMSLIIAVWSAEPEAATFTV
jgi:hypothetical protein